MVCLEKAGKLMNVIIINYSFSKVVICKVKLELGIFFYISRILWENNGKKLFSYESKKFFKR